MCADDALEDAAHTCNRRVGSCDEGSDYSMYTAELLRRCCGDAVEMPKRCRSGLVSARSPVFTTLACDTRALSQHR
eukprot:4238245-Pleurochrysis_carterae.AAC.1